MSWLTTFNVPVNPLFRCDAVFEKGKKNLTYYYTPFGSIQIGIDATSIEVKETEDEIRAEVKYALDVNYEFVGDCHINIAVKKKGAAVKIA